MKVLNFGSLNVDHVYRVPHIARPGETVAGSSYLRFAGGKGANQSVALARAGAAVAHAGSIGPEGLWLRERLAAEGVDVLDIRVAEGPGGHALIQVDDKGQNSIVLFAGANAMIGAEHLRTALQRLQPGDVLLLQNEINATPDLLSAGRAAGVRVVFNPAPMSAAVLDYPLDAVDLLIVNEHEAAALAGGTDVESWLAGLARRLPRADLCLTLGADGAVYQQAGGQRWQCPAPRVKAVDTTAAGDTFIGYYLAAVLRGAAEPAALRAACRAAAVSVTRPGAMDSIPRPVDVDAFFAAAPALA
jgi:ribokinase